MEVLIIILDFFLLTIAITISENNEILISQNNNTTFIVYAYVFTIYVMTISGITQ